VEKSALVAARIVAARKNTTLAPSLSLPPSAIPTGALTYRALRHGCTHDQTVVIIRMRHVIYVTYFVTSLPLSFRNFIAVRELYRNICGLYVLRAVRNNSYCDKSFDRAIHSIVLELYYHIYTHTHAHTSKMEISRIGSSLRIWYRSIQQPTTTMDNLFHPFRNKITSFLTEYLSCAIYFFGK